MIRIFIIFVLVSIVLPLAYFNFTTVSLAKKMLIVGGATGAAAIAVILQFLNFAFYIPLLALVGISLIASLAFARIIENEEQEKVRRIEERKARKENRASEPTDEIQKSDAEPVLTKSFAMQTIGAGGEER